MPLLWFSLLSRRFSPAYPDTDMLFHAGWQPPSPKKLISRVMPKGVKSQPVHDVSVRTGWLMMLYPSCFCSNTISLSSSGFCCCAIARWGCPASGRKGWPQNQAPALTKPKVSGPACPFIRIPSCSSLNLAIELSRDAVLYPVGSQNVKSLCPKMVNLVFAYDVVSIAPISRF